jgi:hypothetical protein
MLYITVRTTSDGLIAGVGDGRQIVMQYPRAGIFDFVRTRLFARFCSAKGLECIQLKWGRERILSAPLGSDPASAADVIDECIGAVFAHDGPFAVDLNGFDWKSAKDLM